MAKFEVTTSSYGRDDGAGCFQYGKTRFFYQVKRPLVCMASAHAASGLETLFSGPQVSGSVLQLETPISALLLAWEVRADLSLAGRLPSLCC